MTHTRRAAVRFGVILTLLLSSDFSPRMEGQSGDPKAAKDALETYVSVVSKIYPPAGGVFGTMIKMLEFTGYFGKAADPVGEMLSKINTRLDEHAQQIAQLFRDLNQLRDDFRGEANWTRFNSLQRSRDTLRTITDTIAEMKAADKTATPTPKSAKTEFAGRAREVANMFLDFQMWQWSDKSLKDQSWTNNLGKVETVKSGAMTEPDFKSVPTLEYYTTAIVVWAATIEYAAGGDAATIRRQYGSDLERHITQLTQSREWNEAAGIAPASLPEHIRARITGFYVPNKYPEANGICYIPQYIRDDMRRVVNSAEPLVYQAVSRTELCTVPANRRNSAPEIERAKEREYGVDVMANLAALLVNLRDKGTVRGAPMISAPSLSSASPAPAPFTGRHKAMFEEAGFKAAQGNALEHNILYSVSPDGTLTWYRHLMQYPAGKPGIDVKHSFNPSKTVGSGWASGVRAVMPMGLLGIYALKDDGTLTWNWHTGFADGANTWAPSREIAKGLSGFAQVVAQDQGIFYGRLNQGDPGIYWGGTSNFDNRKGTPAATIGLRLSPPNINFAAFRLLFGGGNGVLYAIGLDGNLYWMRHHLYRSPAPDPVNRMPNNPEFQRWVTQWAGPTLLKTDLQNVKHAFSSGEGHLYFVLDDGKLVYQRHPHWDTPTGRPVKGGFLLPRVVIAEGWGDYKFAFARNTTSDAGSGLRAVDMVVN